MVEFVFRFQALEWQRHFNECGDTFVAIAPRIDIYSADFHISHDGVML